jgi:hypothetical protein
VFSPTDLATSTCITQRVLQSFTLKCSFHLVGASNRLISTAAGTSPGAARAELLRMRRNSVQRAVCCTSFGVLGVLCCFMTDLRARPVLLGARRVSGTGCPGSDRCGPIVAALQASKTDQAQ